MHGFETSSYLEILMKRLIAICATVTVLSIGITITIALVVGGMLGRPIQMKIGNPPADLNAQPIAFQSDSGSNVHGWWCPTGNSRGSVLLLPGKGVIDWQWSSERDFCAAPVTLRC